MNARRGSAVVVALAASLMTMTPVAAAPDVSEPSPGWSDIGTWDVHRTHLSGPLALAVAGDGAVWSANRDGSLTRTTAAGELSTSAPPGVVNPVDVEADPSGDLWVLDDRTHGLLEERLDVHRLTPAGTLTTVGAIDTPWPGVMAVGADGDLWFGSLSWDGLRRMTPAGALDDVGLPEPDQVAQIAGGAGGPLVWFATWDGAVGRVVSDGGGTAELLTGPGDEVTALVGDPDGSVWFATRPAGPGQEPTLVHLTAAAERTSRTLPALDEITSLTRGPDGHLWFTDAGDRVGHLDPGLGLPDAPLVVIDHVAFDGPRGIIPGPGGDLWLANGGDDTLSVVTVDGVVSTLAPPARLGRVVDVAVGPDGRVWASSSGRPLLTWFDPAGTPGEAVLPQDLRPSVLAVTTDGTVWFGSADDARVGRRSASGSVASWPVPGGVPPTVLAPASDGGVWFSSSTNGTTTVGHLSPTGVVDRQVALAGWSVSGLAQHPDGSVWIVLPHTGVRRWAPTGGVSSVDFGELRHAGEVAVAPDGAVWVADLGGQADSLAPYHDSRLVRIAPDGAVRSVALPLNAEHLAVGPYGDVWFSGAAVSTIRVGKVSAAGVVSIFDTGPDPWAPGPIAAHPDGGLWVGRGRTLLRVEGDCGEGPFADVAASHPFCAEITWLARNGITQGHPDGTFRPGATVDRQAMATFLWRLSGSPTPVDGPPVFADVPVGHPFFDPVQWMGQTGLSTGSPSPGGGLPRFGPGDPVTRQAMAAFLWRLDGSHVGTVSQVFHDVGVDHPFAAAVQWVNENGIATGTPGPDELPAFRPGAPISRQALAAFIQRSQVRRVITVFA